MANITVIRYRRIFWVPAVFMSIYMLTVTLEATKQRARFTKDSLDDTTQNEFRKERVHAENILNIEMKQRGEMEAVQQPHEQHEVNKNAALVFELAKPVRLPVGDVNRGPVLSAESVINSNEQLKLEIGGVRTNGCDAFLKHAAHPPTLVPLSTQSYTPKIFHFIHYNEYLSNPRYLCSLESAAPINPNYQINVYARNSSHFKTSISKWLSLLGAAIFSRIFIRELVWKDAMMGTPLEQWYISEKWKGSSWVDQNLGNAFRLGILHHYGGVYLDLDIVSLNPVESMTQDRTVAMQDAKWYNNAMFRFPPGDAFVKAMMEEFVSGFEGFVWARNGPRMKAPVADMCQSLLVLPANKFFPIQYEQREQLFAAFEDSSVGIHWWNKRVQSTVISTRTVLTTLMIAQCPIVLTSFSEEQLGVSQTAKLGVPASVKGLDPSLAFMKGSLHRKKAGKRVA
ncbi:nucleotide-diphospho-sugar transferase [Chytriomyces cf. hyalinus JEL632]|nr:nucleotide-diphospho-sugar transferase [Chytriomyces cf. hyalinus JEL632]